LVSAPRKMLARKPELRQHMRAWKVASSSRSLSITAKIRSGSTVADTTARAASAGKAAATGLGFSAWNLRCSRNNAAINPLESRRLYPKLRSPLKIVGWMNVWKIKNW
jgi:hypothetical protein